MSPLAAPIFPAPISPTPISSGEDHTWELRGEEFEDGLSIRRFECVGCGAVRFE